MKVLSSYLAAVAAGKYIVAQYEVKSETSGSTYIVSLDGNGDYSCGCLGWTRHVPRRNCKHIDWVIAFGPGEMDPLLASMRKVQRRAAAKKGVAA
jgi:hypothetical protein